MARKGGRKWEALLKNKILIREIIRLMIKISSCKTRKYLSDFRRSVNRHGASKSIQIHVVILWGQTAFFLQSTQSSFFHTGVTSITSRCTREADRKANIPKRWRSTSRPTEVATRRRLHHEQSEWLMWMYHTQLCRQEKLSRYANVYMHAKKCVKCLTCSLLKQ